MAKKNVLFFNEEQVLQETAEMIEQLKDQNVPFFKAYKQLSKDYRKLLRHTKLLVKLSDIQQNHLTTLAKNIEVKNEELIKLNQEKNEFISIVAHDLRNPLNGIKGGTGLILDEYESLSKNEFIELIKIIEQSSNQMLYLVSNLLDINAIESGKINLSLIVIDLLPIVQTLVNHYEQIAQAKNLSMSLHSQNPLSSHFPLSHCSSHNIHSSF